jgi:hypothetical protein
MTLRVLVVDDESLARSRLNPAACRLHSARGFAGR